jgi:hypothetical protein
MALVRSMPIVAGVRTWQFAYTYGYEEDSYKMCLHSIRLSTSYTLPCQNVYYVDTPYLNHYLLHCLHMQSVFFYTRGDAEPANGQRSALPVMELSFLRTLLSILTCCAPAGQVRPVVKSLKMGQCLNGNQGSLKSPKPKRCFSPAAPRQESTPHTPRNFSFFVLKLTDCDNQRGLNQAPSPNWPTSGAESFCTRKTPKIRFVLI